MKLTALSLLLTVGTSVLGYSVYRSNPNQFAPIVHRIETLWPTASQTEPSSVKPQSSFYAQSSSPQAQPTVTEYDILLRPHLEAAFSPLEANRGKLSEDPLLRLREIFLRDRARAEARDAILLIDRLLGVMRERETFRARLDNGAEGFNDRFFQDRVGREWLERATELAPPFQRDYAALWARGERLRAEYAQTHRGYEYHIASVHDEAVLKPHFEDHRTSSFGFGGVAEHVAPSRNPLEHAEYHNPLEHGEYHNPLEQNSAQSSFSHQPHPEASTTTTGSTALDHHPATTGPSTATGLQAHPYVNPFSHPATSAPAVVAHPAVVARPQAVVTAPVSVGGGA